MRKLHAATAKGSKRHFIWISLSIVDNPLVLVIAILMHIQRSWIRLIMVVYESLGVNCLMLLFEMLS